jgi:AcrR family transcriptional regulator
MARLKTAARREAILATAKEVFQERSFDRASMDEIADRLGSSKATLYRYFDTKEALFQELISQMAIEVGGDAMSFLYKSIGAGNGTELPQEAMDVISLLDPIRDIEQTLKEFGRLALRNFHTPQRFAASRMLIAAAADPKLGRLFYEQGSMRAMKLTETYFARVIGTGQLRKADPTVIARHFRGLLESEVHEAGLFNVQTTLEEAHIAEVVDRAVDVFLRAYRPPSAI